MRISRFYYPDPLSGPSCDISDTYRHRLTNVLRLKVNDELRLFDGRQPFEYAAKILSLSKKRVTIEILNKIPVLTESSLELVLWQAVSRSDRMDYALQKAVELGVKVIRPVTTERSPYKLKGEKLNKKMYHWNNIIIHACEQSGRCILPELHQPEPLGSLLTDQTLTTVPDDNKWFLSPRAKNILSQAKNPDSGQPIVVLIGAEGGFTEEEEKHCNKAGFQSLSAGPRILRTETAATAILAWAQMKFGDMGG